MFLLYNIVSDIIVSVVVCVDFLGTHMASLVLLFKTGCDRGWPLALGFRLFLSHIPFPLPLLASFFIVALKKMWRCRWCSRVEQQLGGDEANRPSNLFFSLLMHVRLAYVTWRARLKILHVDLGGSYQIHDGLQQIHARRWRAVNKFMLGDEER